MKINDHLLGQQIAATKQPVGSTAIGMDFQQLLAGELQKAIGGAPVQAPDGVASVPPVEPSIRLEGLAATEETITTLDAFAQALGDGRFTADALEPYVYALEGDTVALLAVKNQLPAADPLAQVLERVATVAYLETAKYRRGDYLA